MIIASAPSPTGFNAIPFIEIALIIFVVFFIGMLFWLFVVRRRGYQQESRIPLNDDRIMTTRESFESTHLTNCSEQTT